MGLVILCPGQGAQHPGMFDLALTVPAARAVLEQASAAAEIDLVASVNTSSDIFRNAIAQPLLCAVELATWTALAPLLPTPSLFAGYSVGELAAYACASALSATALTQLAKQRAALMDAALSVATGLIAVRDVRKPAIEALVKKHGLAIAIINGDDHFILGGPLAQIEALQADPTLSGAKLAKLPVSIAAHTPWLTGAQEGLRATLQTSTLAAPKVPILAGINAHAVTTRAEAIETLAAQVCTALHWSTCLDEAVARGARVFLELGPGAALAHMTRERFPDLAARSVTEFRSLDGVAEWVRRNLS